MSGWRRILRLGITTRDADDDGALPVAQTKAMGRTAKPTALLQPYGLHSTVPSGTPGVLARWLGYRESRFFLPTSWRLRKKNSPVGDVVLFQPEKQGTEIILQRDGSVVINTDGTHVELVDGAMTIESIGEMTLKAPCVIVEGDLTVTGEADIQSGVIVADSQDVGKLHTHAAGSYASSVPVTGSSGGPDS